MDKRKLEIGVSCEEFLYVLHSCAILYQFIVLTDIIIIVRSKTIISLSTTICMSHSHLSIKMFESSIKLKIGGKEIKCEIPLKLVVTQFVYEELIFR